MKTASLKITKRKRSDGSIDWKIYVPAHLNPSGKPARRFYKTRSEAEVARGELLAAARSRSKDSYLSNSQIIDAQRALEILSENGLEFSLARAIELALPTLQISGSRTTVDDVFSDFQILKTEEWAEKTNADFRFASRRFLQEFSGRIISSITDAEITSWLNANFSKASYRANILRTIRPAFSYAVRRKIIPSSPFSTIEQPRLKRKDGIDIFTPEEAQRLLAVAPPDCKAAYALLLFAGIRPHELTQLRWMHVKDGFIHITPSIAKTSQVRNVEIEDTLVPFLAHRGAPDALICPPNWKRKNQAARAAAGLSYRQDTARHSYASYYLAKYKSLDALKMNLGHSRSSNMLFAHYRAAATPAEAERYWSISPDNL